jgi:hypothetical protein
VLILRIEVDSVNHGGFFSDGRNTFIFDCFYHDYGTYGFWGPEAIRLAIVGLVSRRLGNNQHFIRLQGTFKAFIAYNEETESNVNYDGFTIREETSQVYVIGNRFTNSLGFLGKNTEAGERDGHFVLDGNTVSDGDVIMRANHTSFRNNIIVVGATRGGGIGISTSALAGTDPMNVTICNNSFYGPGWEMVFGSATNVVIKNNVYHTTLSDATGMRIDNAMSSYQIDNNIYYKQSGTLSFNKGGFCGWQAAGADVHGRIANPQFVSTDPSSPDFLKLSAASPALPTVSAIRFSTAVARGGHSGPKQSSMAWGTKHAVSTTCSARSTSTA